MSAPSRAFWAGDEESPGSQPTLFQWDKRSPSLFSSAGGHLETGSILGQSRGQSRSFPQPQVPRTFTSFRGSQPSPIIPDPSLIFKPAQRFSQFRHEFLAHPYDAKKKSGRTTCFERDGSPQERPPNLDVKWNRWEVGEYLKVI